MSTHAESGPVAAGEEPTTWVTGFARFAGVLLIISGLWGVVVGISGILVDKIFVSTPQYAYYFDITGWGWVHLILGVPVAGHRYWRRKGDGLGAQTRGGVASASLLVNFVFIPHYPIWSILIIVLDVLIIWALPASPGAKD